MEDPAKSTASLYSETHSGSAVLVHPEWLLTAAHVVKGPKECITRQACFDLLEMPDSLDRLKRKTFSLNPDQGFVKLDGLDVCLVRLNRDRYGRLPSDYQIPVCIPDFGDPAPETKAFAVGHRFQYWLKQRENGKVVSKPQGAKSFQIVTDIIRAEKGFSGGPLCLAESGKVAGIATDLIEDTTLKTLRMFATSFAAVRAKLNDLPEGKSLLNSLPGWSGLAP